MLSARLQTAARTLSISILLTASLGASVAQLSIAAAQDGLAPGSEPGRAIHNAGEDVVRLNDGSVYRGIIEEQVPGSHVVIVLVSGEKRRFEAGEIAEAGAYTPPARTAAPVSSSASVAPADAPAPSGTVAVKLEPTPGFSFFERGSTGTYERLCMGACTHGLRPGVHTFAMGRDPEHLVKPATNLDVRTPTTIDGYVASHRGKRIAGGIVLGAGVSTGLIMLIRGIVLVNEKPPASCNDVEALSAGVNEFDCDEIDKRDDIGKVLIPVGAVTTVATAVIGGWLVSRRDRASIRVRGQAGDPAHDAAAPDPEPLDEPPLPADELTLQPYIDAVRACPELPKAAVLSIQVDASGAVTGVDVDGPNIARVCVSRILEGARFRPGQPRTVTTKP